MKLKILVAMGISAMLVASALATAQPASAAAASYSGRPGFASWQMTAGGWDASGTFSGGSYVSSGQFTTYRSPASSGTQLISIRYRIWQRLPGGWSLKKSLSRTYTVYAGQYVADPGWVVDVLAGFYATDIKVTWRTTTGALLGSSFLDLIESGDYQCFNSYPVCWVHYQTWAGQYGIELL